MTGEQLSIDDALNDLGRVIPSRSTDPDTSRAAEPVKVRAGTQRAILLEAFSWAERFRFGIGKDALPGLTDEQAMQYAHGVSASSEYAKRCSELREGGFIEPTGETRTGAAGAQRIVSRITDKGRAWIRDNR